MDKNRLAALAVAFAAVTGVAGTNHATADDSRMQLAQAAPAPDPARAERGPRGPGGDRPQLFTPEERQQFEQKMRNAKTPEERAAARQEMRAAMEQRAKEKGIELPKRGPMAGGERRGGDIAKLFTPEERAQLEQKMRGAKTPEERDAARKEMRAAVEQRAREKGVELPRRGGGDDVMAKLFTQQERDAFREKMKNAKDQDERRKLMQERHAAVEARAKEKGITLPERGSMHHRHMQQRPDGDTRPRTQG